MPTPDVAAVAASRFDLAPPRRFILPAVLLLLCERPGYGYGLLPCLQELGVGRVDLPAVYRALSQLERDGLLELLPGPSGRSRSRHVYRITALGEEVLRRWMGVVKVERDTLARVLTRYQASGSPEALLAAAEGGWAPVPDLGWSELGAPSAARQPLRLAGLDARRLEPSADAVPAGRAGASARAPARRWRLLAERSALLIEARSTVGPLSFGVIGVTGWVQAAVSEDRICADAPTAAWLSVDLTRLRSGKRLYDAELLRRVDAHRFPTAQVRLRSCQAGGPADCSYQLCGELTFHGVTRTVEGTVTAQVDGERLVIDGEQTLDIREFDLATPTVLMLHVFPDVRILLHAEAQLDRPGQADGP